MQTGRRGAAAGKKSRSEKQGGATRDGMQGPAARTGERDIIAVMRRALKVDGHSADDLGYGALSRGIRVAVNTETMVQGTDIPRDMTLRQAARKSVIACMSDFAAKGIRPRICTISVNIPRDAKAADIAKIARGFADALLPHNIPMVAGDTNAGSEFVFNVCMVGACGKSGRRVGRGGASVGDSVFVTGPFGYTSLGLEILLNSQKHASGAAAKRALRSVMMPETRIEFGVRARSHLTSSMDSSDGLGATLNEMAQQSRCEFEVHAMPATRQLTRYARQNGMDLEKMVLYGGEEYEMVFTAPPSRRSRLRDIASRHGVRLAEIGTVAGRAKKNSGGAAYLKRGGGRVRIADSGWDHFAGAHQA